MIDLLITKNSNQNIFTSESVTQGHPDKMCDQIADAILDELLAQDPNSRVAVEVTASEGNINVFGEVTSKAKIDYKAIVRKKVKDIGYKEFELSKFGLDYKIFVNLNRQSGDISMGVNKDELGAGDQGMMFGYACNETEEYMPLGIILSHKLCQRLAEIRKRNIVDYLKPDGKAQVSISYSDTNEPLKVKTIVISTQHEKWIDMDTLKEDILNYVIKVVIPDYLLDKDTKILINPTGRFVNGGPSADAGLTGRKIMVDTYGSKGRHGGGAFSGKDATKVDRSGAYLARYIAKNIVAAKLASACEVQIAYAIGVPWPVSFKINTFGTSYIDDCILERMILKYIDMRPSGIIRRFGLKRPMYSNFSCYGHFGKEQMVIKGDSMMTPWEMLDLVATLQLEVNKKENKGR